MATSRDEDPAPQQDSDNAAKDVYEERNIRLNLEEGGQAKECHPQGHDQSVTPDTVQMETERYSPLVPLT
jgi:hypothetical protein